MNPSLSHLRKKAAALAERIPLGRLHPTCIAAVAADAPAKASAARTASQEKGDRAPTRWALALSGGADSVALLLLLWAHYPARRADLLALHYNHRLRGAAADEDDAFCLKLCEKLGVELRGGRRPDGLELRSEAAAREARFAFFYEQMAAEGAGMLWLGHQQNDVAETLLMRLVRGSGTGGLAAPRPVHAFAPTPDVPHGRVHLRPLLTLSRAEIEAALRECGIPWREDETNAGGGFFRNRIRRDVLPALINATEPSRAAGGGHQGSEAACAKIEAAKTADGAGGQEGVREQRVTELPAASNDSLGGAGRDALAGMSLSRELLDEDATALDTWADAVAKIVIRNGVLDLRQLNGDLVGSVCRRVRSAREGASGDAGAAANELSLCVPRAVKRRVLYRWLHAHAGSPPLSRQAFEALLAAVEAGKSTRQSLGKTGFALIRKRSLQFEPSAR